MKQKKPRSLGKTILLEGLAKQQAVTPVVDLDEISALGPVDDDPDESLHFILSKRRARLGVGVPPLGGERAPAKAGTPTAPRKEE